MGRLTVPRNSENQLMTPSTEPETIEACLIFTAWMRGTDIYISLSDEALRRSANYRERISVWSQATKNLNSWRRLSLKGKQRMRCSFRCGEFRHTRRVPILFCLLRAILPFGADRHRRASHKAAISYHSSSIIFAGFSRCRDEIF